MVTMVTVVLYNPFSYHNITSNSLSVIMSSVSPPMSSEYCHVFSTGMTALYEYISHTVFNNMCIINNDMYGREESKQVDSLLSKHQVFIS